MELELDGFNSSRSYVKEEKEMNFGIGKAVMRRVRRQRIISKSGKIRAVLTNVPKQSQLYLSDIFTTLLDVRWRYVFIIFSLAFLLSWLIFGTIWWGIFLLRQKYHNVICVEKVDSWTSSFLFSLETQTTIGYGGRQITTSCPEGVICLILQCIAGLLISSTMLGLIFAKLSRPQRRRCTVLFSKHAVVAARDGKVCLMFRVADIRTSQLLEAHIRVHIIRRHVTEEGEEIAFYQQNLPVFYDMEDDSEKLYLFLPITVMHEIDEESPLFNCSADTLLSSEFEIVAILEGVIESTGMTLQARTSYLSDEIHWGHLFVDIMNRDKVDNHGYRVDFSRFHDTYVTDMPRCSPKEYYEMQERRKNEEEGGSICATEQSEASTGVIAEEQDGAVLVPNGHVGSLEAEVTKL